MVDNNNFADACGSFGVTAYAYRGKWADGGDRSLYIGDKQTVRNNGTYDFSPSVFWPGEEFKLAFFAYAPYGAIDPDGVGRDGLPEFSYTVPDKIEDQKDLLAWWGTDYSRKSSGTAGADAVDIDFRHLCTAVKFKMGEGENLQKNIKSISLKGVYREGTWSAAEADGWNGGHWTLDSGIGDFSVDVSSPDGYQDGTEITAGEKVFMMLPQTLPDGAEIEVVYNDGSSDQTLTASIAGTDWGQGEMVVYRISHEDIVREPTLKVNWLASNWVSPNQTTNTNISVSSCWNEFKDGQETGNSGPVPWHLEYQDESGNWVKIDENTLMPNRWVKFAKVSGEGGTAAERIGVTIYSQRESADPNPDHWSQQNEDLMKLAPLSGIHDLSVSQNGLVSTANCYIVNAPGTYRLPLVYGNAVKYGKTNSSASISNLKPEDVRQGRVLTHFVDYMNRPIESPLIEGATDATLLWIDDNICGGIDRISLVDGNMVLDGTETPVKYLEFTVVPPMRQSNAVIVVKDAEGTTIWSWHIWMTDYVLGEDIKTVQNYAGKQYEFMPVNIGWVDSQTSTYPERGVPLRVVQDIEGGEIFSNGIYQYATTEILVGNGTTYQFGKKDPTPGNEFLVLGGRDVSDLDYHNESNDGRKSYGPQPFTVVQRNAVTLGESISHPETGFFSADGYYSWYGTSSIPINLWDVNNDEDNSEGYSPSDFSVTKSVYDPSPVGFTVAPYDAYTGFVTDPEGDTMQGGHNSSDELDDYNTNYGMHFHCAPSGAGDTIFFPWSKMRGNNGRYGGSTGSSNVYWIASPKYSSNYESYGYVFSFSYGGKIHATAHGAGPSAGYNQAVSVRPVRETD